jgi:hypothetical protein
MLLNEYLFHKYSYLFFYFIIRSLNHILIYFIQYLKIRGITPRHRSDGPATRPDALQSSRRIHRSSASVRMMWQYRPDANLCSTSKRISFAETVMGR